MKKKQIKTIKIKNFRGIENIEINDCKTLNIILGNNNTCKTTILESIEFIEEPLNIAKHNQIISRTPELKSKWINNYTHAFKMKNTNNPIDILVITSDDEKHHLEISGEIKEIYRRSRVKKTLEEYINEEKKLSLIKISNSLEKIRLESFLSYINIDGENRINTLKEYERTKDLIGTLTFVRNNYAIEQEKVLRYIFSYKYNDIEKIYNILDDDDSFLFRLDNKNEKVIEVVYSNPLDYLLIENSLREIDYLIKNAYKNEILELLRLFEKNIVDLNILSTGEIICNLKEGYLNVQSFGDGLKKVLILFSKLISARDGILLIDEIETGIHHSRIEKVYEVLFETALKNNTQIFLTTHNLETVRGFLNILNNETKNNLEEINIYRIETFRERKIVRKFLGEEAYNIVVLSGGDLR